jgi:hypothetical protein
MDSELPTAVGRVCGGLEGGFISFDQHSHQRLNDLSIFLPFYRILYPPNLATNTTCPFPPLPQSRTKSRMTPQYLLFLLLSLTLSATNLPIVKCVGDGYCDERGLVNCPESDCINHGVTWGGSTGTSPPCGCRMSYSSACSDFDYGTGGDDDTESTAIPSPSPSASPSVNPTEQGGETILGNIIMPYVYATCAFNFLALLYVIIFEGWYRRKFFVKRRSSGNHLALAYSMMDVTLDLLACKEYVTAVGGSLYYAHMSLVIIGINMIANSGFIFYVISYEKKGKNVRPSDFRDVSY